MRKLTTSLLLLAAATLHAQRTTHIPTDAPTIQSAIDAASPGDTLLVAPGAYFENLDLHGKSIALVSAEGPSVTILDGRFLAPVVTFATGETRATTLTGFTLRHGAPAAATPHGGAILLAGSSPTLTGNILTENRCAALDGTNAAPLLTGNTISLTRPDPLCAAAAPILLTGTSPTLQATLRDNVIEHNDFTSALASAIALLHTSATLTGNILRNNTAAPSALLLVDTTALLQQNLVHANTTHCAPVVSIDATSTAQLLDNTIADNLSSPEDCPQTTAELSLATPHATLINNILASSTPHPALACTAPPAMYHNLLHNTAGPIFSNTCPVEATQQDPLFADRTHADYHLTPGSPAIDAGSTAIFPLPGVDLDFAPRTQNGHIDLGVYQHAQPRDLAATTTLLTAALNPAEAFQPITLLAQVTSANTTPTGSVTFTADTLPLATLPLDPTGRATFTTSTLSAGTLLLAATYSGSTTFAPSASTLAERVFPATTLLSFAVTPSTADETQSVTLSASAKAPLSTQTPTGQVQFLALSPPSAPTLLATATLDPTGHASTSLPSLSTGTWLIDAVYLGSPNFQPVTLPPSDALTLSIAARGYLLTAPTPSVTIQSGHHAPVALTLRSLGAFASGITLACASLPASASCTFSPASPSLTAGQTLPVTMTLDTDAVPGFLSRIAPASTPTLAFLAIAGLVSLRRRRRRAGVLLTLLTGLTGCTSKYPDQVPSGTYAIQVVSQANGASSTQTLQITLNVTN